MKDKVVIDLNKIFNKYFFNQFTFILDNKIVKNGRLKLFSMKGFNLKFFLVDPDGTIKNLEIPYPFALVQTPHGFIFDYRLEKLQLLDNTEHLDNLEDDCPKSRFFDKPLYLKIEGL